MYGVMRVRPTHSQLTALWALTLLTPALLQVAAILIPGGNGESDPRLIFLSTAIGALVGLAALALLFERAKRLRQVQLGYLATLCVPVVLLSFVRGILTPDVFVDSSNGFDQAGRWSVPLAFLAGAPLLATSARVREAIDPQWNKWRMWVFAFSAAIALLFLTAPDWLPTLDASSTYTRIIVGVTLVIGGSYAAQHLTLARRSRSHLPLIVALGFASLAASSLYSLTNRGFDSAAWVSQLLTMSGVFLVTLGAMVAYRGTAHVHPFIAHLSEVDPRSSLEIGVEPTIHRYVRFLNAGNARRRDHVISTSELAMKIGRRLELSTSDLRSLGLATVLHDVGQPEFLHKNSAPITTEMTGQHPDLGAKLVSQSPTLAPAAPIIAAHHERIDGLGYPRGVYGAHIPLPARILAACDAFDALLRAQHRSTADVDAALTVLEQNAGTHWDRRVVETVARHIRTNPPAPRPADTDLWTDVGCDCLPDVRSRTGVTSA